MSVKKKLKKTKREYCFHISVNGRHFRGYSTMIEIMIKFNLMHSHKN